MIRRRLLRLGASAPREGRFVPPALGGFSHGEDRLIAERVRDGRELESLARRLGRPLPDVEARARSLAGGIDILLSEGVTPIVPAAQPRRAPRIRVPGR